MAAPSTTASLFPSGLYTCLVGSATETDPSRQRPGLQDPYNRPGELVGLRLDGHELSCQVIDGHRTVHPRDGRVMRSTVSCVVHSDNNSAYVTGGFDGNIAVWSDDKLAVLARFGGHGCAINAIGTDSKTYGILYGTSKGELIWCSDLLGSPNGVPSLHTLSGPRVVLGQNHPLANSLDVLLMTNNLRTKTRAFAGYGYLTENKAGAVHVYDLAAMQACDVYKLDNERALTDIALHPEEHLLAVASGILFDDKSTGGDGVVRLYDIRSSSISGQAITTRQTDIHRISFSPCGDLLYSNDATSGLMLVHDIRYPSRPIWSHSHSANGTEEHFLCFAWMPNTISGIPSGLLWTGGNDHKLQLWDLRRPESLVEQHDLGQPINNAVVSSDGALVWAGTEVGSVHLLAKNTSLTDTLGRNIKIAYDSHTV
jgi:WD40 repeat protein